jgi:uncharacterized protein YbjT (DUF2867 family)
MKLVVFGATGPTGRHLVSQALAEGHEVTAFARRRPAIEQVRIVQGDAFAQPDTVAAAIRGQDAVLSALGVSRTFFPHGLIERSVRNIVQAMEREGVRRFVLMSAFGVGDSKREAPALPRLMYGTLLRAIFADKKAAEDYLRARDLDWTIVYPVLLTNGPLRRSYRVGERLPLRGMPTISRADVAHFMLSELARPHYVRRVPVLSY